MMKGLSSDWRPLFFYSYLRRLGLFAAGGDCTSLGEFAVRRVGAAANCAILRIADFFLFFSRAKYQNLSFAGS